MDKEMISTIREYLATQPVLKAWLFGSYSRGEQTPESDVDLLVRFDKDTKVGLFAHTRMILGLEERLGRRVDLVPEGALMDFAKESVARDRLLIYSRT